MKIMSVIKGWLSTESTNSSPFNHNQIDQPVRPFSPVEISILSFITQFKLAQAFVKINKGIFVESQ